MAERDTDGLTGFEDAPRPFVLHFPEPLRSGLTRGERLRFDLILLGQAPLYLPHLVEALRGLERSGLGDRRRADMGRVRLTAVEAVEPGEAFRLLEGPDHALRPAPPPLPLERLSDGIRLPAATRMELRFQTPLRLMHAGRWVGTEAFELHHLVRALSRRLEILARVHGTSAPEVDLETLVEASEDVRLTERALRWRCQERYSSRQRRTMPVDGLLGHVVCEGDLAPLLPLLATGQLLHAGSKTTMGLGQYALRSLRGA